MGSCSLDVPTSPYIVDPNQSIRTPKSSLETMAFVSRGSMYPLITMFVKPRAGIQEALSHLIVGMKDAVRVQTPEYM